MRTYTEAVRWFAAAHLLGEAGRARWAEVGKQDVQEWIVWLLGRYNAVYASNRYRALLQFFRWLAMMSLAPSTSTSASAPGTLRRTERSSDSGQTPGQMTASGIYQVIARRDRQCGVEVFPHRFRHHFSHTWTDRGGAEGDLMGLNGWASPQMLRRYGASTRSARARRSHNRVMGAQ